MNKKIIKVIVLVLVFFVSLVSISLLTDEDNVNLTSEMPEATLPVVYLNKGNQCVNELFGYREEMDLVSMRDNLTPLSEDLVLPITIQAYQAHVEGISYEVRTMDAQRLLESNPVADYSEKDGVISTQLQLQQLMEKNVEYRLILKLECDGEEIHYYSRIIYSPDYYVDESIQFVLDFHRKTFDMKEAADLALYLDPNSDGDNTTLQKVTIHSSLRQVAWADLKGEVLKSPIPQIQELSGSYNTIVLRYVLAASGTNGETKFYNVEEYYRIRYSTINNRMLLLDYERTMNEIFRGNGDHFTKTGIQMGIRSAHVSFMTNETGNAISFVQEGDLWNYNCNSNQLSLVYSFRGVEGINDRENHGDHDIRIIQVGETGSTDFVVYGYMNRGDHEGKTGVGVYHYDAVANTVQEELFVQSDQSYQVLKELWGELFYVSGDGMFYMLAEDELYRIRLSDGNVEKMQTGLDENEFAASAQGRYISWWDQSKGLLTVTDLEGENAWTIAADPGTRLQPIGFVESDFIYGIADAEEEDSPMYKLIIMDQKRQIIKEYEKTGYFITNAYVDQSTVVLERVRKNGEHYSITDGDSIKSSEIEASQRIRIETGYSDVYQTQVILTMDQTLKAKNPQLLTPKEVVLEETNLVNLESKSSRGYYYVYLGDRIVMSTQDAGAAIRHADEIAGVVVGEDQRYVWRRGRSGSRSIDLASLPYDANALATAAEGPQSVIQLALPDAEVLNLDGCTLSQVLYFVGQGAPVYTLGVGGEPLLITGYDDYNITIYDFSSRQKNRKSLSEGESFFAEGGNVFFTYLLK